MLIPIKHENMSARRWPLVTFALIAINVVVFLATFQTLEDQQRHLGELKLRLTLLASAHPELHLSSDAQQLVESIEARHPKGSTDLSDPNRTSEEGWEGGVRVTEDLEPLQAEVDSLEAEIERAKADSIVDRYAFAPAHPTALSYITANFLHGGWLHLIGNMWFLWLAGFVLEDFWGRWLYSAFYLIAGAAAMQFDAWLNPGSMIPTLGASGAVAALMGAFLVRFPKMRIEMLWWAFVRVRFRAPAYCLLPAWLLMEVFYGSLVGQASGVAHWAHVGGFVFGALAAWGLRFSGIEHKANQQIEQELTLECDPEIQRANELIDHGQLDRSEQVLKAYVANNPGSVDGLSLLRQIYSARNDPAASREILAQLCAVHLKAGENELAWKTYDEFLAAGGETLAAPVWLDLCRAAEALEDCDRAVLEYEKLASAYPTERQSVIAQLGAARLCLKRLQQPQRALELFQAAANSKVPHLDWEQMITEGLREARAALPGKAMAAAAVSQR